MLILRRQYANLLGEPIRLDIYRFSNCCQIMITKSERKSLLLKNSCLYWIALLVLIVSVIFSFNFNKILDRRLLISICFALMIAFFCWPTLYRESVVLLDSMSGLEVTQHYSVLGRRWKRSHFILSAAIIINEAITMHRVIYYLVSIPLSLSTLLLSDSNNSKSKSESKTKLSPKSSKSTNNLIPLFCHTCPRLDCLKVMYKHIQTFKSNTNRVIHKQIFDEKLNNWCIKSFSSQKSLTNSNRKNGFKSHKQN